VTFTAANALSGSASTMITVSDSDRAPVVSAPATASGDENTLITVEVSASDPDGEAIASLTATDVPTGATFTTGADNLSGTLSWTPDYTQAGSYTVTFTAANALSGSASTVITVNDVDRAPVVTAPATVSGDENTLITVEVSATDPDGDAIASLTASDAPTGAAFTAASDNLSGTLTWTPDYTQAGSYTVTFTVANALTGSAATVITVNDVGLAPIVTAPASASGDENTLITVEVSATDPDGDAIASLTAIDVPTGATFTAAADNLSGTLAWTPDYTQAGSYTVTFTAANDLSGSAATAITVNDTDRAPVVSAPATATGDENSLITIEISATDPDGDAITALTATDVPTGATFTASADNLSGTLAWTPDYTQAGTYTVTFTAANALSGSASTTITVNDTDRAPSVTAPATASGQVGTELTVNVSAADPDGDAITSLTATNVPSGATFAASADQLSGTLTWTPEAAQAGTHTVTFTAANALSGSASTAITVNDVDHAPVVTAPATVSVNENELLTITISVSDPDGDSITNLTATGLPAGATFTAAGDYLSGTLTWTPEYTQAGSYEVTFAATNSLSGSASTAIMVNDVDRTPLVTAPATAAVNENAPLTVLVSAADPDGEAIASLTATGVPSGATFTAAGDNLSGTLSWTPSYAQAGSYTVTFTAANALSGSASSAITVSDVGQAPVVTAPATAAVNENELLTVLVSASDPDGDAIASLTAADVPAGAAFTAAGDNLSGTFTWTPDDTQSGSYTVIFTAANALTGSASTVVTVNNADRAPVVTAPATASGRAGTLITVAVTAADPDGDAITSLTASGLPSGATFTAGSENTAGTLSWTPASGQVGTHSVTFTAANTLTGSATTTITVQPPNQLPVAALTVTPSTGNAPLSVTANASASTDPDGTIATYLFDFGDGTVVGPIATATAAHSFAAGTWTITVTVTDNDGAVNSKTASVIAASVPAQPNLVGNPSFETNANNWNSYSGGTLLRVAGGFDGAWGLQVTGAANTVSFGANDSPNWVVTVPAVGTRYRFTAWVRSASHVGTAKLQIREYSGSTRVGGLYSTGVTLSPTWQLVTVDYVTVASGSTLDFQVIDFPVVASEVFVTDNIAIRNITGASLAAGEPSDSRSSLDLGGRIPLRGTLSPSPLRSQSTLVFATSRPGPLQVTLYDVRGRRVRILTDETNAPAGLHRLLVDGRRDGGQPLASGVYFYRIQALEGASSGRFVIAH